MLPGNAFTEEYFVDSLDWENISLLIISEVADGFFASSEGFILDV